MEAMVVIQRETYFDGPYSLQEEIRLFERDEFGWRIANFGFTHRNTNTESRVNHKHWARYRLEGQRGG